MFANDKQKLKQKSENLITKQNIFVDSYLTEPNRFFFEEQVVLCH